MRIHRWGWALLIGWAAGCVPVSQQSGTRPASYYADKQLRYENYAYESSIRTDQIYPLVSEAENPVLEYPIVSRTAIAPLIIEFDEIGGEYHNYYLKLLHCNADWRPSILNDIEFLNTVNQFPITEYGVSRNTYVPYIHYRVQVPPVKVTGNYVAVIYRDQDERDVVLTRRFVVYEQAVNIDLDVKFSTAPRVRYQNQQVDFKVRYGGLELLDPMQQVKVVIRQNNRWDNAITDLQPIFFDPNTRLLDYTFFELENNFKGGNEFRVMDIRSVLFNSQGVDSIRRYAQAPPDVYLMPEGSRNQQVYTQLIDINGQYIIDHFETRTGDTESDYPYVHFRLVTPPVDGEVYVFGELSGWRPTEDFRLTYDAAAGAYTGAIPLKQGFYNYVYAVQPPGGGPVDDTFFEGSYQVTENVYDVLVYYRQPGGRADRVIGYASFNYFGREGP